MTQLARDRYFTWAMITNGAVLVISGLFLKVVLADNIAPAVDRLFAIEASSLSALDTWTATFLFGYQIYFDFAGYSLIAIGSAKMLGLTFPHNFNWPYLARSPREFWQRWHISLSAWIRDYLYLPLTAQGFKTRSTGGIADATTTTGRHNFIALFLTWFIMGLWHGAGWTFVLWGLHHAVLIALYRVVTPLKRLPANAPFLAWTLVLASSMAGWIGFRAQSLGQALVMYGNIFDPTAYSFDGRQGTLYDYFWVTVITMGMVMTWSVMRWHELAPRSLVTLQIIQGIAVAVMVFGILISMQAVKQFIYFQF